MARFGLSQPVPRREGHFIDDRTPPGALYAVVLRAPFAHARTARMDPGPARSAPGVRAVYTGADLAPALMILDEAEVEIAGAEGGRALPLGSLYTGDGERYLALEPDELVTAVRARRPSGLRTGYDKVRVRQSIDYPRHVRCS